MGFVFAFYQAVLVVLFTSGAIKLWRPDSAAQALGIVGFVRRAPVKNALVWRRLQARVLGGIEIAIGSAGLVGQYLLPAETVWIITPSAASVAIHIGFFAFIVRLGRADPSAACGCFGAASEPPGFPHRLAVASSAFVSAVVSVLLVLNGAGIRANDSATWLSLDLIEHTRTSPLLTLIHVLVVGVLAYLLAAGPTLLGGVHHAVSSARSPADSGSGSHTFHLNSQALLRLEPSDTTIDLTNHQHPTTSHTLL